MTAFDPALAVPGSCPHEESVADIGGGKSYCGPWGCWTNCREVGHCVFAESGAAREAAQLAFDFGA